MLEKKDSSFISKISMPFLDVTARDLILSFPNYTLHSKNYYHIQFGQRIDSNKVLKYMHLHEIPSNIGFGFKYYSRNSTSHCGPIQQHEILFFEVAGKFKREFQIDIF